MTFVFIYLFFSKYCTFLLRRILDYWLSESRHRMFSQESGVWVFASVYYRLDKFIVLCLRLYFLRFFYFYYILFLSFASFSYFLLLIPLHSLFFHSFFLFRWGLNLSLILFESVFNFCNRNLVIEIKFLRWLFIVLFGKWTGIVFQRWYFLTITTTHIRFF